MVFVGKRLEELERELVGRDMACWKGRCMQEHEELADSGMDIGSGWKGQQLVSDFRKSCKLLRRDW